MNAFSIETWQYVAGTRCVQGTDAIYNAIDVLIVCIPGLGKKERITKGWR